MGTLKNIGGNSFYLFAIAVILLSTKISGTASKRVRMPAVAGALAAGIILGPSCLSMVEETDFIQKSAELGVIMLMFQSGLETDLRELKENGIAAFAIALSGVILPLMAGTLFYSIMYGNSNILNAVFIGVTLTATSVSITAETLKEMGRLSGKMGAAIMGAAIIDDIIGIAVLTAVTGLADSSDTSLLFVLIRIVLFFIFVFLTGLVVIVGKKIAEQVTYKRRMSVYALSFCLLMSFCAEELFGVADITGAYFAGIVLCSFGISKYIGRHIDTIGYLFFFPVFFADIGLKTNLKGIGADTSVIWFATALTIIAIITKSAGCGISARLCKFSRKEALAIGIGMVSRGEVALIVAQKGLDCGLLDNSLFPAIVFMVVVTTLVTPLLLGIVFKARNVGNN